jgi:hypothetical protein
MKNIVCASWLPPPFAVLGATGATSLIIKHLRCNIWRNICATEVQHFIAFVSIWLNLTILFGFWVWFVWKWHDTTSSPMLASASAMEVVA